MGNEGGRREACVESSLCSKMKCESRVGVGAPRAVRVLIHACRSKEVRRGIQVRSTDKVFKRPLRFGGFAPDSAGHLHLGRKSTPLPRLSTY